MASNPANPNLSHIVQITLRDGSTFTHTAQFSHRVTTHDPSLAGLMVVEAVCCKGLPNETTSRHTFPNDITTYAPADIQAEILDHVTRLATHHASAHKAQDFVDGLQSQ